MLDLEPDLLVTVTRMHNCYNILLACLIWRPSLMETSQDLIPCLAHLSLRFSRPPSLRGGWDTTDGTGAVPNREVSVTASKCPIPWSLLGGRGFFENPAPQVGDLSYADGWAERWDIFGCSALKMGKIMLMVDSSPAPPGWFV